MLDTKLRGARTHNLVDVSLDLSAGTVVCVTGPSGAGKSSLAMDTLYAEGQRRFVESFSPYARQFLERLERPPMKSLDPVLAGVAVDRRAPIKSSRSTVATMSDIAPYLSALFLREALPVCPEHDHEAITRTPTAAREYVLSRHGEKRGVLTYSVRVTDTEQYLDVREQLLRDGYRRLWVDGAAKDLDEVKPSVLVNDGQARVVVDRLLLKTSSGKRFEASLESAYERSGGSATLFVDDEAIPLTRSLACPVCGVELEPARPGLFSYESPLGACPTCRGFGRTLGIDFNKVIPDPSLSLDEGAIRPWRGKSTSWERAELRKLCRRHGISTKRPWQELSNVEQNVVLGGDGDWDEGKFPGVIGWFDWLKTRTYKMHVRVFLSRYRSYDLCATCKGARLGPVSLSYRVGGLNLREWNDLEVSEALAKLAKLEVRKGHAALAREELLERLRYLQRVGLGYLSLSRQARTLSGGEAQRVTLTTALGTSLNHTMFVLDEPTVGLHPIDIESLNQAIHDLAEQSNLVLVVEHDASVIAAADRVLELGPGAGDEGGRLVFDGTPKAAQKSGGAVKRALRPLSFDRQYKGTFTRWLEVVGPSAHNLRMDAARLPLGSLTAITGPSGSGKSTLAVDIIYRALARKLGDFDVEPPEAHEAILGAEPIFSVELVDQAPLGRTSRGNAATYSKAWDAIRKRFAETDDAKARRLAKKHFSFNVAGGRCEECNGEGYETVEMQFLADVHLPCPSCRGRRFKDDVLEVQARGVNIFDVLSMSVEGALSLWRDDKAIFRALEPLVQLGLGYLKLGQSLSTLSGGEAQRLRLARALSTVKPGALLILDEPSAGLHSGEVEKVIDALRLIVRAGGSVIMVEHDLEMIVASDYVVDLGPSGGRDGGHLVTQGTPDEVAQSEGSTAKALRRATSTRREPKTRSRKQRRTGGAALVVQSAREHNLRGVSVSIPHGKLTVVTGPSGSGKSSLCFDVIFAEGQRRFLETLTPYARQFLPTMSRPDVERVLGVPPAIALEQRTSRAGAKSTVATVTEVAHYLRLLYAKLGTVHCPDHDVPVRHRSVDELLVSARQSRGQVTLLAHAVRGRKGTYLDLFNAAARDGIEIAICDGKRESTETPPKLSRQREHDIALVVAQNVDTRELDASELARALHWGKGTIELVNPRTKRGVLLSSEGACPTCGFSSPALDPRHFSFNTRQGRCGRCEGNGVIESRIGNLSPCPSCEGTRLGPLPRAVKLHDMSYPSYVTMSVSDALAHTRKLRFFSTETGLAQPIVAELTRRLAFLEQVGLDYVTLDRAATTLSGGEMQRLRLAAQLGAGITGALYILDEPTIGLHPSDTLKLLENLRRLVDIGSTVLVVEHDIDTIRAADHVVDLGPGGGRHGGRVVAEGTPKQVMKNKSSPTGQALRAPTELRAARAISKSAAFVRVQGARMHNLSGVDAAFPIGCLSVVAGVSGSGKSSLVQRVLLPALRRKLGLVSEPAGPHDALSGSEGLKRALAVDQSPIGRTPRSTPATFLGIWDEIRKLYARSPEARVLGFGPARFSFNTPRGGRCPACEGQGTTTHEMSFLPDLVTPCAACGGARFEPRTLEVRHQGASIADVLALTAEQAVAFFANHPRIVAPLQTLTELGAGYITLGQGSHTLSGGEAQRLKLATELTATVRHEPTLYVLDEPTTGLHVADVSKLMRVLDRLVERGDTLVVIEHHPEVIAGADWLVELGPGGGKRGGRVVYQGPPKKLMKKKTRTAQVVRRLLER